jgi:hypothetical protein
VVSEEKIFEKVYRRTMDDGRQVMAIAHTDELKQKIFKMLQFALKALPTAVLIIFKSHLDT